MFDIILTPQQNTVIYACFIPMTGLIFLLFLIKRNHLFSRSQSTLFQRAVSINLLLIVLTAIDYLLSTQTGENVWIFRRFTSMAHFSIAPLMPFLLLRLYSQKKPSWYIYIPIVANAFLCMSTFFAKTVFFISTDNTYARGPLFLVPLIISFFYVLLLMANPMISHRQGKRQEILYLFAVLVVVVLATVLEISLHLKCMEYGACAIGLIMYYILQSIHYFSSDPLTGAYNRQMYNHMLENVHRTPHSIFALIDINDFKAINDQHGHEAGDNALILFVSILNEYFDDIASIYRIGGDEFMLVSPRANMASFLSALAKARSAAAENSLFFACGIAEHQQADDVSQILSKVDREMYIAKGKMK